MLHSKKLAQHGCETAYAWLLWSRQSVATTAQSLPPRQQRPEVPDDDRPSSSSKAKQPPDFTYNAARPAKLPYPVMRNVLHNKEVYLEDVKLARFLTARRASQMYGLKLDASRTLAMVLGNVTRRTLLRLYNRSRRVGLHDRRWRLITAIESRLDMTVLRMGLCHNIRIARDLVRHGRLTLNGNPVTLGNISVCPGDVVSVLPKHKAFVQDLLAKDLSDFLPEVQQPPVPVHYMPPEVPVELSSQQPGELADRVRLRLGPVVRVVEEQRQKRAQDESWENMVQQALTPSSPAHAGRWRVMGAKNPFRRWDAANLAQSLEERQQLTMRKLLALYSPASSPAAKRQSDASNQE